MSFNVTATTVPLIEVGGGVTTSTELLLSMYQYWLVNYSSQTRGTASQFVIGDNRATLIVQQQGKPTPVAVFVASVPGGVGYAWQDVTSWFRDDIGNPAPWTTHSGHQYVSFSASGELALAAIAGSTYARVTYSLPSGVTPVGIFVDPDLANVYQLAGGGVNPCASLQPVPIYSRSGDIQTFQIDNRGYDPIDGIVVSKVEFWKLSGAPPIVVTPSDIAGINSSLPSGSPIFISAVPSMHIDGAVLEVTAPAAIPGAAEGSMTELTSPPIAGNADGSLVERTSPVQGVALGNDGSMIIHMGIAGVI